MEMRRTIVLAEDHAILRDGLKAILDRDPELHVVCEAADGREALRCTADHQPDLLVLDLTMPRTNGMEVLPEAKRVSPGTRVLVLTVHDSEEYVLSALRAGADGYVLKDSGSSEFLRAVRVVLGGQRYLTSSVARYVVDAYLGAREPQLSKKGPEGLTIREREILKLVAEGYRNREMADYLCISEKTVEKHRASLMRKLQLDSVSGLVAYAVKKGLVTR